MKEPWLGYIEPFKIFGNLYFVGTNTLCKDFLDKYSLPYSLRDDFKKSMLRLNKETVDIFGEIICNIIILKKRLPE